jgi:hypothetical protein
MKLSEKFKREVLELFELETRPEAAPTLTPKSVVFTEEEAKALVRQTRNREVLAQVAATREPGRVVVELPLEVSAERREGARMAAIAKMEVHELCNLILEANVELVGRELENPELFASLENWHRDEKIAHGWMEEWAGKVKVLLEQEAEAERKAAEERAARERKAALQAEALRLIGKMKASDGAGR